MATVSETVRIIFEGVNNTSKAADAVAKSIRGIEKSALSVTAPLANVTTSVLKFEAAVIASGAALGVFAASTAQNFQRSFAEIATLIDEPIGNLDAFRQEILDYAQDSTASLEQVTTAVYSAISAGVDYEKSLEAVRQAEQLALAGNAELGASLAGLVGTLNAYGLGMEEAARFSDILFTTVRLGQTTLPELNASLAGVTGIAATAGVSFEEVAAAIATLTATGTPTAQAVTQLTGIIAALLKPSKQASDLARELGLQFDVQALKAEGLSGVLENVREATGGNETQMAQLFGRVEALNAAFTLTGLGSDKFASNLVQLEQAAGATGAAADKFGSSVSRSGNALELLLIKIGDPLRDALAASRGALADIADAIGQALGEGEGLAPLADILLTTAQRIEDVLTAIARNLPAALEQADLSGFTRSIEEIFTALSNLFESVFGDFDITTTEGLVRFLETASQFAEQLGTFSAAAIEDLELLVQVAFQLGEGFLALDRDTIQLAGSIGAWATQINAILPSVNTLLLAILAFGPTKAAVGGAITGIGALVAQLGAIPTGAGAAGAAIAALGAGTGGTALVVGSLTAALGAWLLQSESFEQGLGNVIDSVTGLTSKTNALLAPTTQAEIAMLRLKRAHIEAGESMNQTAEYIEATRLRMSGLLDQAVNTGKVIDVTADEFEQLAGAMDSNLEAQQRQADAAAQTFEVYDAGADKVREISGAVEDLAEATGIAADEAAEESKAVQVWAGTYTNAKGEIVDFYRDKAIAAEESADRTGRATQKEIEFAQELKLKLLELATDERIANIEAKASINVAEIEAQAEQVVAAFDSIGATVQSTGDLLGDLFGAFAQASFTAREFLEEQIELEQERRTAALELQKELTEAQIRNLDERTDALRRGDATIKIEAANLTPALEIIWNEILREINVKASAEGREWLLGLPT